MGSKKKILFITSSLNLGGAERQLLLLCQLLETQVGIRIISLDSEGPLKEKYLEAFPNTLFLNEKNTLRQIKRLKEIMGNSKPDVVVTWLYKADLLGGISAKLAGSYPVVWSARNSNLPHFSIFKGFILSFCSKLLPKKIIANGKPAYDFHKSIGYPTKKMHVIPNTLAPWTFNSRSNSRLLLRNVHVDRIRIGIAARQVSGKGILESIKTFEDYKDYLPQIDLTLIGQKTIESKLWNAKGEYRNHSVCEITNDEELSKWFQSLDLYLMSSTAWESQPNSLLEAIAIGCPVLVSDYVELDFDLPDFNQYDASSASNLVSAIRKYVEIEQSTITETVEMLKVNLNSIYNHDIIKRKWLEAIEI
jgi:glycosyltransferase involved in cell wall biosynthesis